MATAEQYAQWIVDNQALQGTPEFSTVAEAYRASRTAPQEVPKPPPSTSRTWGEATKDIGAGLVSGVGSLVQLPGQLYGLATGNMEKTGALGLGQDISKYGAEMKSEGLKAREEARSQKIAESEQSGQFAAAKTAFWETLKDPALLINFLAEQAPQLAIPFGAAKVARGAALAGGAGEAAAIGSGTRAAIGAGAVQQGADVGAQTYESIYKELVSKGAPEQEAKDGAINLARAAGASGAIISLLAQKLPGAARLEESFAGAKGAAGRLANAGKTALGEMGNEVAEETGGQFSQNLALRNVKPEQSLTEGLGRTAGMAAVGGVGMGGVTGALQKQAPAPSPAPTPTPEPEAPPVPTPLAEQDHATLAKRVAVLSQAAAANGATQEDTTELGALEAELQQRGVKELEARRAEAVAEPTGVDKDPFGNPVQPKAEETPAGDAPTAKELEAAGQQTLNLPRPVDAPITLADIEETFIPMKSSLGWLRDNVIGKTQAEVQALVDKQPELLKSRGQRAKILDALLQPEAQPYQEPPNVRLPEPKPAPVVAASEPSVGVPRPAARAPTTIQPTAPASPQGAAQAQPSGLVRPEVPPTAGAVAQREQPSPLVAQESPEEVAARKQEAADVAQAFEDMRAAEKLKAASPAAERADSKARLESIRSGAPRVAEDSVNPEERWWNEPRKENAFERAAAQEAPEAPLSPEAEEHVREGNAAAALHAVAADTRTSPVMAAIAQRLKVILGPTKVSIVDNLFGGTAHGAAEQDGLRILLDSKHGINTTTLVHEGIHAATERVLRMDPSKLTDAQRMAVKELGALWKAAKANPDIELSAAARGNLSEFITEAMTERKLMRELQITPWKMDTAWNWFKKHLLQAIGITDPKTMRDAVLASADTLFSRPEAQQTKGTREYEGEAPNKHADGTREQAATQDAIDAIIARQDAKVASYDVKERPRSADEVRTMLTDTMASVMGKLDRAAGTSKIKALMRQAASAKKFTESFMLEGGLEKDLTTGSYAVVPGKTKKPPAEVFTIIKQLAVDGTPQAYAAAKRRASMVMEGMRLNEMRKANPARKAVGEEEFAIHLKDPEIDALVREYHAHPEYAEMTKVMDSARTGLVDHLERVGRLTPEQAKEWREVINYVPFDRVGSIMENFIKVNKSSNRGIGRFGGDKDLRGDFERPVKDVFENYVGTMEWMLRQVVQTDAVRAAVQQLASQGLATHRGLNGGGPRSALMQKVWVDGVPHFYELQTKYDKAAFADPALPPEGWVRTLNKVSNVLRTSITALPPFSLKQVVEDTQRAMLTSGVKHPWALVAPAFSNFVGIATAEIFGKRHPLVAQFGAKGITGGVDTMHINASKHLQQIMGYEQRSVAERIMQALHGITRASDLAVRAAVHSQTLKETGDKHLADTRARELINFDRHGAAPLVQFFITTVPFFNAFAQGTDIIYRAATGRDTGTGLSKAAAQKQFYSRAAMMMGFSLMYAMAKSDDDDYKKMNRRERNGNWIVGGGFEVPVPGEMGALFKVTAENVIEYLHREGTPEEMSAQKAVGFAMRNVLEQYVGRMVPIPGALKPVLEAVTNHSFLTGRELEGQHQQGMDANMRKNGQTSELATAIADFAQATFGDANPVSPIKVDQLLSGYFGGAKGVLTLLTDSLLNPDRVDRPISQYLLLSNYMYDTSPGALGGAMEEFYDLNKATSTATNTLNELMKSDTKAAMAYMESHKGELALNKTVHGVLQQLGKIRATEKLINSAEGAKTYSQKERAEILSNLKSSAEQSVQWVRSVEKAMGLN